MREVAYLWRCAGFGATPVEFNRSLQRGYEATVDFLLTGVPETEPNPPPTTLVPPGITLGFAEIAGLITWWLQRMVETGNPLREKMTLFWHSYFTTSADPVFSPELLLRQNQLFREGALGRFEDLLLATAKDPAMLIYLDGLRNSKNGANENFGREVMEMFSVGAGQYGESDVRSAARAFTGWGVDWWSTTFAFHKDNHDDGPKRFLGHTGELNGEDVLHDLAAHRATADHVCDRLFQFFTGQPEAPAQVAQTFREHHGHMKPVLKTMFLSPEFRNCVPGYLSPVEYLVGLVRVLQTSLTQFKDWNLIERLQRMGQLPFLPPSVRGWPGGKAWINTASLRERIALGAHLLEQNRKRLGDWLGQHLGDGGVERLLALCGRSDASSSTKALLAKAYTGDAWRAFSLLIQGPEMHLR